MLDSEGQPLEFANVVALSLPDTTVTKGTTTDRGGAFSLRVNTQREQLLFRVSLIGYRTALASPLAMDSIVLADATVDIDRDLCTECKKKNTSNPL